MKPSANRVKVHPVNDNSEISGLSLRQAESAADIFWEVVVADHRRKAQIVSPEALKAHIAEFESLSPAEQARKQHVATRFLNSLKSRRSLSLSRKEITFDTLVVENGDEYSAARIALGYLGVKDYDSRKTNDGDMLKETAERASKNSGIHIETSGYDAYTITVEGTENLVKLAQGGVKFPGSGGLLRHHARQSHSR